MKYIQITVAALLLAAMPVPASATLLGDLIDIRVEMDLPDFGSSGSRVFEDIQVEVDGTVELTVADEIANPSGWSSNVAVDVDGILNTITVFGEEIGFGYQTIEIWLSDLDWIGESGRIENVSVLNDNLLTPVIDPTTLSVAWTDDTVHLSWIVDGLGGGNSPFFAPQGSSTFQITAVHVPEPATLALFGLGLAGLGFARRKKA